MKRAILTKVSEEQYKRICKRMKDYGFASVYEFVSAIVGMALNQMDRMEALKKSKQTYVEDEIDEMFADLAEREAPRYGERTKRGHDEWDKYGDQEIEHQEGENETEEEQGL